MPLHACVASVQLALFVLFFPKNMYKEKVMEKKKFFVEPEVEVVRFDVKDVITASPANLTSNGVYNLQSIKDFFNITTNS